MRFGAALMVAVLHVGTHVPAVEGLTWFGWVGVQIFFVLSGFVIAYSAESAGAFAFFRARVVRIAPAVLVCASLTAAVFLARSPGEAESIGGAYLRTLVLWPGGSWLDAAYWTLPVEVAFYGLVLLAIRAVGFKAVEPMLIAIGLASTTFAFAKLGYRGFPEQPLFEAAQMLDPLTAKLLLIEHGADFATGAVLWLILARGASPARLAALAVCMIGASVQVALDSTSIDHVRSFITPVLVWVAAVAVMAGSHLLNRRAMARFGRHAGAIRQVGLMTFPLYLLHGNVGLVAFQALKPVLPLWGAVAATAALVLALSYAIARFIEPPVQGQVRSLLTPVRARRSPS